MIEDWGVVKWIIGAGLLTVLIFPTDEAVVFVGIIFLVTTFSLLFSSSQSSGSSRTDSQEEERPRRVQRSEGEDDGIVEKESEDKDPEKNRRKEEVKRICDRIEAEEPHQALREFLRKRGEPSPLDFSHVEDEMESEFPVFCGLDNCRLSLYEIYRADVLDEEARSLIEGFQRSSSTSVIHDRPKLLRELEKSGFSITDLELSVLLSHERERLRLEEIENLLVGGEEDSCQELIRTFLSARNGGDLGDKELGRLRTALYRHGHRLTMADLREEIRRAEQEDFRESILAASDSGSESVDWGSMSGEEFEEYVGDLFRRMGYEVESTSASGDQGADLLLAGRGEEVAVQVKRYSGNVGNQAVQQAIAARDYFSVDRAMVVTNSSYTNHAWDLASQAGVELWDGRRLRQAAEEHW